MRQTAAVIFLLLVGCGLAPHDEDERAVARTVLAAERQDAGASNVCVRKHMLEDNSKKIRDIPNDWLVEGLSFCTMSDRRSQIHLAEPEFIGDHAIARFRFICDADHICGESGNYAMARHEGKWDTLEKHVSGIEM